MSNGKAAGSDRAWKFIEEEKRRDVFLRRVSKIAWAITFVIILIFTIMIGVQVAQMIKVVGVGAAPMMAIVGVAIPLVIVLGFVSLLIATLTTVGIFLRFRTASLTEIQLRLAALEDMLTTRGQT